MSELHQPVVLTGFMGAGKSDTGAKLAQRLHRPFIDLDRQIETETGKTIRAIFAEEGESGFRRREGEVLEALLDPSSFEAKSPPVIATGGGALIAHPEICRGRARVFYLSASARTCAHRLVRSQDRPLLDRPEGVSLDSRIGELLEERVPVYRRAGIAIATDERYPQSVVNALAAFLGAGPFVVTSPSGPYEVHVGAGESRRLGRHLRLRPEMRELERVFVIADAAVWPIHGESITAGLVEVGIHPGVLTLPGGEPTKNRENLAKVQDFLLEHEVDRKTPVIAVGGGVITDLAGFAAATVLRGVPFLPVPTSLLAQVDASVGGKVAIDHVCGKNLLGAFHHPMRVVIDPDLLSSLPEREMRAGWAEVVKMAALGSPDLMRALETAPLPLESSLVSRAIREAVGLKAEVVRADPHEAGLRRILNLGHTVAHAIEREAGFGTWNHGEAVAIGLVAAMRLGIRAGITEPGLDVRIGRCLTRLGLPCHAPGFAVNDLQKALRYDKKRVGGRVAWVLLRGFGDPVVTEEVETAWVDEVLRDVGEPMKLDGSA